MKSAAISRFVIVAAIVALVVVGGNAKAWAACPTSPNYTPDFSSEPTSPTPPLCLTLNGAQFGTVNSAFPALVATSPASGVNKLLRLTPNQTFWSASAWFNNPQPVTGTFSTTFTFEFTNPSNPPADGIAFVIQNSPAGTAALDIGGSQDGCGLGFGQSAGTDGSGGQDCTSPTGGIPNSVAVEFDTYTNPFNGDPSNNHVAIQSCGSGPNNVDGPPIAGNCRKADKDLTLLQPAINMADGHPHTVTITYTPAAPSGCGDNGTSACPANLHVILDTIDLFAGGVAFDMASINPGAGGTAYVGFTGATGGSVETQDIWNWTFTPQQQSGVAAAGAASPTVLNYSGGPNNTTNGFEYDLQLDANNNGNNGNPDTVTGNVTAIVMDQKTCNKLVQKNFPLTQCFVFQNADGKGHSGAVLFELTCTNFDGTPSSNCGDTSLNNFAAALGTSFIFQKSQNLGFQLLNSTIGPYPGWLKGDGGTPGHPCIAPTTGFLFQSNQITSFTVKGDPLGTTKGKSGGSGSCWTATYATFGEAPPGVQVSIPSMPPAKIPTYSKGQVVQATYSCSIPVTSHDPTANPVSPVGPYLTVQSCQQASGNQLSCTTSSTGTSCTGTINTSRSGILQVFAVTSRDTGGNVGANAAIYNVK